MADTIKSSSELKIESGFVDSDTRTITLLNPRSDLTAADILAVETTVKNTQPIVGDKGGSQFARFNKARIIEKQVTYLDLRGI